jgi:uncharacterized membrane protein
VLALALAPFVLATLVGLVVLWPSSTRADVVVGAAPEALVRAEVVSATLGPCAAAPDQPDLRCTEPVVRLLEAIPDAVTTSCPVPLADGTCATEEREVVVEGRPAGEVVTLAEQSDAGGAPTLEPGDEVVLGWFPGAGEGFELSFADLERRRPLGVLAAIFAVAVVAFGRWQGLRALVGVGVSLGTLALFVLPAVLDGGNPLAVALVGSAAIALTSLYLTHGLNARTTVALLGTLVTLGLVGVLSSVFVDLAQLTGLADEEASFLQVFASQVDLRGLLLGGMVIGALGVIDDVTVTQVAAVWELKQADPHAGPRRLYGAAVRIGRDHIASTVNTLVLAYAGASLPLLLLFTQTDQGLGDVANGEAVAVEIIRTLTGSIGLVASVPFTTALAALVVGRDDDLTTTPTSTPVGPVPVEPAAAPTTGPAEGPRTGPGTAADSDPRRARSRRERRFWDEP